MYKLEKLLFEYQDLEPFIDTHTIGLHYNKHQKKYLDNLNKILIKNNYEFNYPIEELYLHIDMFNRVDINNILYNWGGVINHNLYWKSISLKDREVPINNLLNKIIEKYGSLINFKNIFIDTAFKLKGSGYTFLVKKLDGELDIINMHNQDNPLLFGYVPLFTIDMWEHAYYLNYKNNKEEYLENVFDIANFSYANKIMNS